MTKRTTRMFLAFPMVAALALSACGGGGEAGRPSVDEISGVFTSGAEELQGMELPEDQADCIAQILVDSEVSDETLRAMVDLDTDYNPSDDENTLFQETVTDAAMECVTM